MIIKNLTKTIFLTSEVQVTFTQSWTTFTKTPIPYHFDLKCHIQIESNASGFAIIGVLNQLTFNHVINQVMSDQMILTYLNQYLSLKIV